MTIPTNGITAEVIRAIMPRYELSTDLLAATFAAIPKPPPDATMAWRQARAGRLVQEVAGRMPANAPQARIAAEIVIVQEAIDDTFARVDAPGLTVEQVCRLRRTASVLLASVATLERSLVRHQQKPVPFFGTVLAEGIDVAALATGWGGPGSRGDDGSADVPVTPTTAGSTSTMTVEASPARAAVKQGPPRPWQDTGVPPGTTCGVVTRLDQGPGWTVDVVRPRAGGEFPGGNKAIDAVPERLG